MKAKKGAGPKTRTGSSTTTTFRVVTADADQPARIAEFAAGASAIDTLSSLLGGPVERLSGAPPFCSIWMDGDARLKGLSLNLFSPSGGEVLGPLVITESSHHRIEGLSAEKAEKVRRWLDETRRRQSYALALPCFATEVR